MNEIIGYRKVGEDEWVPIYKIQPGMIATAAFMQCGKCGDCISSNGGPGNQNTVCPTCYKKNKDIV